MASQDDDDLQLIRASGSLLQDLEQSLPHLLWKGKKQRRVHQLVRKHDLDYVLQLIEPFQPEPQLLDTRLKLFLPPIVAAYLEYLQLPSHKAATPDTIPLDVAASKILYLFCKVRGEKVITAFLNNEPKYLELILRTLEACQNDSGSDRGELQWEKSYVLILWLSHLLLAPFDLSSISSPGQPPEALQHLQLDLNVPSLAARVIAVGLRFIPSATKEQDAASKLLVRLVIRPDMQRLRLPSSLVSWALHSVSSVVHQSSATLHSFLGPLRFLVAMTVSPDSDETFSLIPAIHVAVRRLVDDAMFASVSSSAVTKKLFIKLFRNVALLSLQTSSGALAEFFENTSVLEDTVDYLLQSLGDRDTPVRFAASKALSMIILRLESSLSHEVVQAVLDIMKDDMPRSFADTDFSTVDPLRWHGLTLTLAHALFRRSASPAQLPDIINALLLALTFEQRSTTGSSIGSNVRDAACFGIWSMSRRYSTAELLAVNVAEIRVEPGVAESNTSVIQIVAIHLLLSACLDPAGNIRRGSSAALQELIGRHPDQVSNGIPLVQVVDYHAVGLRQRAAIDVAHGASSLDVIYRKALLMALLRWRGVGSPDVLSREVAATSIGRLCADQTPSIAEPILESLYHRLTATSIDVEYCHGSLLALSSIIDEKMSKGTLYDSLNGGKDDDLAYLAGLWQIFHDDRPLYVTYTPRSLRAELFSAVARAITSAANLSLHVWTQYMPSKDISTNIATIVAGLISRSEETTIKVLPRLVQVLSAVHISRKTDTLFLDLKACLSRLRADAASSGQHGAGRAIALASAFPWLETAYSCSPLEVTNTIGQIIEAATSTEWRVIGVQALLIIVESGSIDPMIIEQLIQPLHTALNDYTITERGDVGSLVRTAAIACTGSIWKLGLLADHPEAEVLLLKDVTRLSLEKLDRTRLQAARCLRERESHHDRQVVDVSSVDYFKTSFKCLENVDSGDWEREITLTGAASSAGVGAEALLQSTRIALVETVYNSDVKAQFHLISSLAALLKQANTTGSDSQPLLEVLAFLLDTVPSLQTVEDFSWRNLLVFVQKSHFKSNNIPKILAAIQVYRGLAIITTIRAEVLKKLASMLKTHPYPRIRIDAAETLFLVTGDVKLKAVDWGKPGQKYA